MAGSGRYPEPLLGAASASQAGSLSIADFNKLATVPAGALLGATFVSGVIDLAATSSDNVIVPAPSGYAAVPIGYGMQVSTVAGVMSTPPTISIKMGSTLLRNAVTNFPGTVVFALGVDGGTATTNVNVVFPRNTAVTVDVSVAATGTGGFAFAVKYWFMCTLIPMP